MVIKLDLEKAYDKMNWCFLLQVLRNFGFDNKWIDWVEACFTSPNMAVLVNGRPQENFKMEKGLRQGDPLSPYLFILGLEVLSRIISKFCDEKKIHGIKLARTAPPLSHLFFADDIFIFGRANMEEANNLAEYLKLFSELLGQVISLHKSNIIFSKNVSTNSKREIMATLRLEELKENAKYLGLPLVHTRRRGQDFEDILDKLDSLLAGWKTRCLSRAGRLTLIKSVGQALPLYAMQTTALPKKFCKEIDSILRRFWWGHKSNVQRGLCLKSWDSCCLPKDFGGLGLRKAYDVNLALLAKWGWNLLIGKDTLCCSILKAKYLKNSSFLDVKKNGSDS